MHRFIAAVGASVLWMNIDCQAQPRDLSPAVAHPTVVVVHSGRIEEWSPTPGNSVRRVQFYPAAGTIVGSRADSLYIMTSLHHVRHAPYLRVQLIGNDSARLATLVSTDTTLDLAVLSTPLAGAPNGWRMPAVPKASRGVTRRVYALGCARGYCWASPEEATYLHSWPDHLVFRSPFLVTGLSGGPLVNEDGALLGIVTKEDEGEGWAVKWDRIVDWLRVIDVPVNLPELQANLSREFLIRFIYTVSPRPGEDHDGKPLAEGGRFEYDIKLSHSHVFALGITRLAFTDQPYPPGSRFAEEQDSYVMSYFAFGYRWEPTVRLFRHGRPQAVSLGVDILLPHDATASVVTWVVSDSIDYGTGEFVYVRDRHESRAGSSFAAHIGVKIPIYRAIALSANYSLYQVNIASLAEDRRDRRILSIGAEFRIPL